MFPTVFTRADDESFLFCGLLTNKKTEFHTSNDQQQQQHQKISFLFLSVPSTLSAGRRAVRWWCCVEHRVYLFSVVLCTPFYRRTHMRVALSHRCCCQIMRHTIKCDQMFASKPVCNSEYWCWCRWVWIVDWKWKRWLWSRNYCEAEEHGTE